MNLAEIRVGRAVLRPRVEEGWLRSLGTVEIGGTPVRHPANRWLPWFDTYQGDVFRQFKLLGVTSRGAEPLVRLATETAQQLLEPAVYVRAVLGG